jgi:hypothetical protein
MRAASAVRLVVGGAYIVRPEWVLAAVGAPDRAEVRVLQVARVLGVRMVAQAGLEVVRGRRTPALDTVVELTHAVSMLPAALIWPIHRRSATVSAAIAAGIAVLDLTERR